MADWRVGRIADPTIELASAVAASAAFPPVLAADAGSERGEVDHRAGQFTDGDYRRRRCSPTAASTTISGSRRRGNGATRS